MFYAALCDMTLYVYSDETLAVLCVAALGRRGWKMFYAALCYMALYIYSDETLAVLCIAALGRRYTAMRR